MGYQEQAGNGKRPEPFSLVIFGASGDLTRRKLVPAVFNLHCEGLLPEQFSVIGFARREKTDDEFRSELLEAMQELFPDRGFDVQRWESFARNIYYHQSTFEDSEGYDNLRCKLIELSAQPDCPGNCLYYLSTQPRYFPTIVHHLSLAGLHQEEKGKCWSRMIVEKPFGHDLVSARQLNAQIKQVFNEGQIYRIDHYLGKETVQNILVLRFANSIFEPLWNHKYIDHVQITVSESVGVGTRGAFYEGAGALRDIVQNHMMQLLALVAMEPPYSLKADVIREEKLQVIKALRPIPWVCGENGVIRAQYTAGEMDGLPVPGYTGEEGVAADSATETFIAFKAMIDNWRWSGVPFYLRTGKRMPVRITEIGIHFKDVPRVLFNETNAMAQNILTMRIQPREGINLRFQAKVPGPALNIKPCQMHFGYAEGFGKEPPEAYERLLLDAAVGDATLFTRSDEVEAAWEFLEPVIKGCEGYPGHLMPKYPAGSWGPKEADEIIQADGYEWYVSRQPKRKEIVYE